MPETTSRPRASRNRRRLADGGLVALALAAAIGTASARGDDAPRALTKAKADAPARKTPEPLNFANGLFRARRYNLAAREYERFLAAARPGPDADDARFGLANALLFEGAYARGKSQFEAFLRQAPDHPNAATAWYRVGETSYMLGDLAAARRAFERYTTAYPDHKHMDTAWPYLGDVCLRSGDLPEARRAYEHSLSAHPDGRLADRARFGLGRALALQGEADAALKAFTTLVESGGKDWADRAWFQIGQVRAVQKEYEKAVAAFKAVESAAPRSPLIAEARLNRAEALVKLGRAGDAEPLFKAVMAEPSQTLAARAAFALGTAQLEAGDPSAALATFDEASRRFEGTKVAPALVFRSAEAALAVGKGADARARFVRASEIDPRDDWADDALARAARLALDQRDPADAAALAATFAARFADSPLLADVRLVAGRAAYERKNYKEAIATLSAALADDKPAPTTAEGLTYYLGLAYRADGQAAKASEVLDALAKTPAAKVAADARFMVGQGHIESKRFAEAIDPLEKYLAAKPDGEVADYALAHLVQARLELNEPAAASKALDQLAERFPKSKALAPSRIRIAEAALAAKRFDRAAEQFARASDEAADPAVAARARLGLGWARLDGGKPGEAAEAFAAYLAQAPADDPLAPEAALAHARALEASDQTEPALAAYAKTAATYPAAEPGALAALARARLLVASQRPADGAVVYEAFVKDHPGRAGLDAVLSAWGWALIDADRPADADRPFTLLLDGFPESPHADDARFNLAESANQAKDHDKVVRLLAPMTAPDSKVAPRLLQSALYRLGRARAELNDWPEAARTLDRLIHDFPDGPFVREAKLVRAEVALESGDAATADALLSSLPSRPADAADLPRDFTQAVRRRRVQALLALKQWTETIAAADALKADAPDDPRISEIDYARGRALQQLARFDDARAAYQAVIDARKGGDLVARAQFMIGETYFHQKDYHEAIRQFLKVDILYDAPALQAAALLEAGKAHEQLSQWADAAETYERLRSRFPDAPSASDARDRRAAVHKHADARDTRPEKR